MMQSSSASASFSNSFNHTARSSSNGTTGRQHLSPTHAKKLKSPTTNTHLPNEDGFRQAGASQLVLDPQHAPDHASPTTLPPGGQSQLVDSLPLAVRVRGGSVHSIATFEQPPSHTDSAVSSPAGSHLQPYNYIVPNAVSGRSHDGDTLGGSITSLTSTELAMELDSEARSTPVDFASLSALTCYHNNYDYTRTDKKKSTFTCRECGQKYYVPRALTVKVKCRDFLEYGWCPFGISCPYLHVHKEKMSGSRSQVTSPITKPIVINPPCGPHASTPPPAQLSLPAHAQDPQIDWEYRAAIIEVLKEYPTKMRASDIHSVVLTRTGRLPPTPPAAQGLPSHSSASGSLVSTQSNTLSPAHRELAITVGGTPVGSPVMRPRNGAIDVNNSSFHSNNGVVSPLSNNSLTAPKSGSYQPQQRLVSEARSPPPQSAASSDTFAHSPYYSAVRERQP